MKKTQACIIDLLIGLLQKMSRTRITLYCELPSDKDKWHK